MSPFTQSKEPQIEAYNRRHPGEYDTRHRTRFFNAWDHRLPGTSQRSLAAHYGIDESTGRKWLRDRAIWGSSAERRTRKLSKRLGRPQELTPTKLRQLPMPGNPVREEPLEVQIDYHDIPLQKHQLQARLKDDANRAQIYKKRYTMKEISDSQAENRKQYSLDHRDQTLEAFWSFVVWTDEAHFDPSSQGDKRVLQTRGTRNAPENQRRLPAKTGNTIHFAGWCTAEEKAEELIFYNDEHIQTFKLKRDYPRPRKSKYKEEDTFQQRLLEWQASEHHEVVIIPKGNSMTEKYYCKRILPYYINAIKSLCKTRPGPWLLQEDGDSSHGTRTHGLASQLRERHRIKTLRYPANSPDLNPQEACWNILKQRVRRRRWNTDAELKEVIQREWRRIRQSQIRKRVAEMQDRARQVARRPYDSIRSSTW